MDTADELNHLLHLLPNPLPIWLLHLVITVRAIFELSFFQTSSLCDRSQLALAETVDLRLVPNAIQTEPHLAILEG